MTMCALQSTNALHYCSYHWITLRAVFFYLPYLELIKFEFNMSQFLAIFAFLFSYIILNICIYMNLYNHSENEINNVKYY